MTVMLMKAIFATTELLSSKNDCFATPITLLSLEIIHERGRDYTSVSHKKSKTNKPEYWQAIFLVFSLVFIEKKSQWISWLQTFITCTNPVYHRDNRM